MGRLLPALLLVLSGCASFPESAATIPDPGLQIELAETPFFPQKKYQCGPAALATVLQASGLDVEPDKLVSKVFLPGRQGSLQVEMLAATRMAGRLPYVLDASLEAIVSELQDGRPVLVLQNLGVSMIPRWHYAVVIGVDGPNDKVILRSGTDARRTMGIDVFLRTWARGDFWAFTALRPGEIPTVLNRQRYVNAVVALEDIGRNDDAALAWRAALEAWPDDPVVQFGLGNTLRKLGRLEEAEQVYRGLLAARPGLVAARNNLAIVLRMQSRFDEAMFEINRALMLNDDTSLHDSLVDTRQGIEASMQEARP